MIFSLDQIIGWLLVYKYVILFPVMVIEGPIITIIAGFLSSLDFLNIFIVFPVIAIADLTGDFIYYAIGRWGREKFIDKWGHYLGIDKQRVEKLEDHFEKHRKKTLIFGKLSHAFGAPILVAAGIVKIPLGQFMWFNFLATVPKSLIFLTIGYYFGQAYVRLNKYLDYLSITLIVLAVLTIIIYYCYNRFKKKINGLIEDIKKKNLLKV